MTEGKLTLEAMRDLLRADRLALERGSRSVRPEHLLMTYADGRGEGEKLSGLLPGEGGRRRRHPAPRSLSPRLRRIVDRAEEGGCITSPALLSALLDDDRLRRRIRSAGQDPDLLFPALPRRNPKAAEEGSADGSPLQFRGEGDIVE